METEDLERSYHFQQISTCARRCIFTRFDSSLRIARQMIFNYGGITIQSVVGLWITRKTGGALGTVLHTTVTWSLGEANEPSCMAAMYSDTSEAYAKSQRAASLLLYVGYSRQDSI